jgi:hypothetical protein
MVSGWAWSAADRRQKTTAALTLFALDQFVKQLADLALGQAQRFPSGGSCAIDLAAGFAVLDVGGFEVAAFFEAMQQGIKGSRADAIAVARQFLHHSHTEDGLADGVMEHVQADQAGVKIAVVLRHIEIDIRFRHSFTNTTMVQLPVHVNKLKAGNGSKSLSEWVLPVERRRVGGGDGDGGVDERGGVLGEKLCE